ncbi:MAG: VOC family protein [Planctomycetota bacterium]|jgi:catechol 2,3-dioxygenase-like lactoylglutathione lyase family enzyme
MDARFKHVNIIAKDWRSLVEFYVQVFGCVALPPARDLQGKWLEDGTGVKDAHLVGMHLLLPGCGDDGPTLEIFQYAKNAERPATAANREGYGHIAFEVEDVRAAYAEVLAAGGSEIAQVVEHEVPGVGLLTVTYVADPEGNIVELQSWN